MSRKHTNFTREILPDPKFHNEMIARFINMVMESGKKSVAEKIVYGAIDTITDKNKSADAVDLVEKALESMFSTVSNASKMAFIALVNYLKDNNYKLLDCQVYNEHLESLGCVEIDRKDFMRILNN